MEPLLMHLAGGGNASTNAHSSLRRFTGSNIQKSPLHLVLYLSHKNYAQILEKEVQLKAKMSKHTQSSSSSSSAFLHYAKAAAIDSSDPALMLKLGDIARENEGWFAIARDVYYCGYMGGGSNIEFVSINYHRATGTPLFTKSASASSSSSSSSSSSTPLFSLMDPTRKACLFGLIEALFELGEFTDCLYYIKQALRQDPQWTKSAHGIRCRWIQHSIIKLHLAARHSLTS
jgi:hypothetical protein